jgi:hypothetical protein
LKGSLDPSSSVHENSLSVSRRRKSSIFNESDLTSKDLSDSVNDKLKVKDNINVNIQYNYSTFVKKTSKRNIEIKNEINNSEKRRILMN